MTVHQRTNGMELGVNSFIRGDSNQHTFHFLALASCVPLGWEWLHVIVCIKVFGAGYTQMSAGPEGIKLILGLLQD